METFYIVVTGAWNTMLFGVAASLIKRWMDRQETTVAQNKVDVKKLIEDNREEVRANAKELNLTLNGVFHQLRIANGRTASLEGKVETISAICEERHK